MSTSRPPAWPYCAHGADPAADPIGCRGVPVPGHIACLAHLADADRHVHLTGLTPGASIDHRGTTFNESLFNALLNALRDPITEHPRLGNAEFRSATFEDDARFESATFQGRARLESRPSRATLGSVMRPSRAQPGSSRRPSSLPQRAALDGRRASRPQAFPQLSHPPHAVLDEDPLARQGARSAEA